MGTKFLLLWWWTYSEPFCVYGKMTELCTLKKYFNWSLITLQYCGGFCHTLTWISHGCTCVSHPEYPSHLPPHPIPLGCPSAPTLSALFHAWNLDWQSISHMVIYMFQCYSLKSSHPCLLFVSFAVSHIGSSLLSKFHIYVLIYCIGVFFVTYFTLYNRIQFHPPH